MLSSGLANVLDMFYSVFPIGGGAVMTVYTRVALPPRDASRVTHKAALASLNAIRLNEDYVRHGFGFVIAADFEASGTAAGRLLAYASAAGLYPADVAAQAIAIRAGWLHDFILAGDDPEIGWAYERFATDPISLADFARFTGPEDDEDLMDDEIRW